MPTLTNVRIIPFIPDVLPMMNERLIGLRRALAAAEEAKTDCEALMCAYGRDAAYLTDEIAELQRQINALNLQRQT